MRERPILLNAEMVRAVLNGSKTQTRRIMSPQPADDIHAHVFPNNEVQGWLSSLKHDRGSTTAHFCPFGQPGDRLWVREKTLCVSTNNGIANIRYLADDTCRTVDIPSRLKPVTPGKCLSNGCYREASRITLEITGVRVERLQTISEVDAAAEGVPPAPDFDGTFLTPEGDYATAKVAFQRLWESIYKPAGWQANPWCWVIEFKRVENV